MRFQITSSTAGGSGNVGEIMVDIQHHNSSGTVLREWIDHHPIEDPIINAIKLPIDF